MGYSSDWDKLRSENTALRKDNMDLEVSLSRMTAMRDDLLVTKEERGYTIIGLKMSLRELKNELLDAKAAARCSE